MWRDFLWFPEWLTACNWPALYEVYGVVYFVARTLCRHVSNGPVRIPHVVIDDLHVVPSVIALGGPGLHPFADPTLRVFVLVAVGRVDEIAAQLIESISRDMSMYNINERVK